MKAWYNSGLIFEKLGNYEDSLNSFNKVLEFDPKDKRAWVNKGNNYEKIEKFQEALECYDKALELDPGYEKAKNAKELLSSKKLK